jgi:hypothetical protein
VVNATPINSQAVTIAAKQGFVNWLAAEAARLSTVRPEGYKSWRALSEQLAATGGIKQVIFQVLQELNPENAAIEADTAAAMMQ